MSAAQEQVAAAVTPIRPESTAPHVYQAIRAVMAGLAQHGIEKASQSQGFKYRSVDQVMNTLAPLLVKHGLLILPEIVSSDVTERTARSGGMLLFTRVRVRYTLISTTDGSERQLEYEGEAADVGDKSLGKAASYAYKEMVFKAFCVPTEGTDDPDAQVHEVSAMMAESALQALRTRVEEHGGDPAKWETAVRARPSFKDGIPASAFDGLMSQINATAAKRAAADPAS